MSANADERQLWRVGRFTCVMISCCAGAELQVRAETAPPEPRAGEAFAIVLRELYPTRSDLYERSHALHAQYVAVSHE